MAMTSPEVTAILSALTPEQIEQAEWRIGNLERITMRSYEISIGVLFGLASLTCAGRVSIRLLTRRRLFTDDAFLIFAYLNLIVVTGILYKRIPHDLSEIRSFTR